MERNLINIAICDDNIRLCSDIEAAILEYCNSTRQLVKVEIYYSGNSLCRDLEKGLIFDILFLDISLEEKHNGVQIGGFIRNQLMNEVMQIVYISSYEKYALELFKNRPMDFLIKPITKDMIFKALKLGIRLSEKNAISFQYKKGRDWNKVYLRDIIYFKGKDREVEMVTTSEKITFYGTLEEICQKLHMHRFFYAHKSYLINYMHVIHFFYDKLIMSNKEEIQIAQTRRKEVRKMQKEFMIGEMKDASL